MHILINAPIVRIEVRVGIPDNDPLTGTNRCFDVIGQDGFNYGILAFSERRVLFRPIGMEGHCEAYFELPGGLQDTEAYCKEFLHRLLAEFNLDLRFDDEA